MLSQGSFNVGDRVHNRSTGKDGKVKGYATWSYGIRRYEVEVKPGQVEVWDEAVMKLIPKAPESFKEDGYVAIYFCNGCGCHMTGPCVLHPDRCKWVK